MSAIDRLVNAGPHQGDRPSSPASARPSLQVAVVTCMDCRLDLFGSLGLQIGEAHLIRNAGGIVTDDVLRSLAISQRALGTREVLVLHHTGCGMLGFDDETFRSELESDSGQAPPWRVPGFTDVRDDTRESVRRIQECGWLPHRDAVRGYVYDVADGRLSAVEQRG